MPQRNVRVDIPIGSPQDMDILSVAVLARHTVLGQNSPLNDPILDMAALIAQTPAQKAKRDESTDAHAEGEALMMQAQTALGTAEGQTVDTQGTLYNHIARVRDRLLLVHEGDEEEISRYRFNVVLDTVDGRKTIRVDIPINSPDDMNDLGAGIIARDTALGQNSPLDVPEIDMADLTAKHTLFKDKLTESRAKDSEGQAATLNANNIMGTGKQQNVQTAGTIYNLIARVRDKLLLVHETEEEELSTYGFNVVITMTPLPGEEEEGVTFTGAVNPTETLGITDTITDESALTLKNTGTVELIFCRAANAQTVCSPQAGTPVAPAGETQITGLDLGASGGWLNVTNESVDTAGAFEVIIN